MTIIEPRPTAHPGGHPEPATLRWSVPEQGVGPALEYDAPVQQLIVEPVSKEFDAPMVRLAAAKDPVDGLGTSVLPRRAKEVRNVVLSADSAILAAFFVGGFAFEHWVVTASALVMLVLLTGRLMRLTRVPSMLAIVPIVRVWAALIGSASVIVALTGSAHTGRELILGGAGILAALVSVRALLRTRTARRLLRIPAGRRCLLVGDEGALLQMAADQEALPGSDEVVGILLHTDEPGETPAPGQEFSVERVVHAAHAQRADQVTVVPGDSRWADRLRELSWALESTGVDLAVTTELQGVAAHRVEVNQVGDRILMRVDSSIPRGWVGVTKGVFDRLGAAALLILLTPLFVGLSFAIRLDSSGPAVFRQTRVRKNGVEFTMYKFRTMHVHAESVVQALRAHNDHGVHGVLFKMKDDPRVTGLGRMLRRTSLDEVPQLINVLRGEMSLIGPRPALPTEVATYDNTARRRLAVKPGMTGLWQVSGRSRLTWQESLRYDLDYVDNWTPARETSIAFRTVRAVLKNDGAY